MRLSAIVACSENRVIGHQNKIPWHLSSDLKRFKQLTMGHCLIMGRKTYESIGRVLPGRKNIILSSNPHLKIDGAWVVSSFESALQACEEDSEAFVIGGERVYETALPQLNRIYLTLIAGFFEGDAYFPKFPKEEFKLVSEEQFTDPLLHRFQVLDRI